MPVVLGKLGIALLLLTCLHLVFRYCSPRTWSAEFHRRLTWSALLVTRGGLFLLLFVILGHEAPSDVSGYYLPQGRAALAGELVYRDFPSSYGPVFPYAVAAVLSLVDSGKAVVVVSILGEFFSFLVWGRVLGEAGLSRGKRQVGELIYVLSPVPLFIVAMGGQQQAWLAAFLGVAILCALRRSPLLSGLSLGFDLLVTKALAGLYFFPLAIMAGGWAAWRVLTGAALVATPVFLTLILLQANPLAGLEDEAAKMSGGNLPFLLHSTTGIALPSWVAPCGVLALLGLLLLRQYGRWKKDSLKWVVATSLVFLLVSQKSFGSYFVFTAIPLFALLSPSPRSLPFLSLFQLALALEASLHFRWFGGLATRLDLSDLKSVLFFLTDCLIVIGYGWMLWLLLNRSEEEDGDAHGQKP